MHSTLSSFQCFTIFKISLDSESSEAVNCTATQWSRVIACSVHNLYLVTCKITSIQLQKINPEVLLSLYLPSLTTTIKKIPSAAKIAALQEDCGKSITSPCCSTRTVHKVVALLANKPM